MKLIMVLSNCLLMKESLPDFEKNFRNVIGKSTQIDLKQTENLYIELESLITNQIIKNKTFVLSQIVYKGLCP